MRLRLVAASRPTPGVQGISRSARTVRPLVDRHSAARQPASPRVAQGFPGGPSTDAAIGLSLDRPGRRLYAGRNRCRPIRRRAPDHSWATGAAQRDGGRLWFVGAALRTASADRLIRLRPEASTMEY